MKLQKKFVVGDKVFAKVRGYPPWPAKIEGSIDTNTKQPKYKVYFFGTGETAVCKVEELYAYADNKEKFVKVPKRKLFHEGLRELEEELSREGVKGSVPTNKVSNTPKEPAVAEEAATAESTTANAADSDAEGAPLVIDEGEKKKPVKRKAPATPAAANTSPSTSSNPSHAQFKLKDPELRLVDCRHKYTQDAPEIKKKRGRGKASLPPVVDVTPKQNTVSDSQNEESPGKEVVSRSGRKIKPKRFADFSSSEETEATADKSVTENTVPPKGRGKAKAENTGENEPSPSSGGNKKKTVTEKKGENSESTGKDDDSIPGATTYPDSPGRFLLARTFAGEYVGIKLDVDRPKTFDNDKARAQWDWATARNAMKLKAQLESGSILPEQVKDALDFNVQVPEDEKRLLAKDGAVNRKKYKLRWLRIESQLLQLDAQIKSNLGLDRADADKCLEAMDDMLALPIDPLMLKKHPHIVETVKRLRRYIGNLADWKLSKSEATIFKQKAEQIRQKAEHIYNKFKAMFTIPEGQSFWQSFSDQVVHFKELTKDMPEEKMFSLMADPSCPDVLISVGSSPKKTGDQADAAAADEPEVETEAASTANLTAPETEAK